MQNVITPSLGDTHSDKPTGIGNNIADSAADFKDNVNEFGRKAADTIDQNMSSAASRLDKAAATLHRRAESLPGVDKMTGLAHSTADKLSATAGYLREHNVNRVIKDLNSVVRDHPGPSLLVAGVAGFLLGRALLGRNRG